MKQILSIILLSLLICSCSSDLPETTNFNYKGVVGIIPDMIDGDGTRTELTYDYVTDAMRFMWQVNDKVLVFPYTQDPAHSQALPLTLKEVVEVGSTSCTARFITGEGVGTLPQNQMLYFAFGPYLNGGVAGLGYDRARYTYLHQIQSENVKIGDYFVKDNAHQESYKASEIAACSHLGDVDYIYSQATSSEEGEAQFSYKHLGSTIRLYLKTIANECYDSIQIYNPTADFNLEGAFNLQTREYNPTLTKHFVSLTLGSSPDGFDLTNTSDGYHRNNVGYIIAYIEMAPVSVDENTILFLHGHTKGDASAHHVYKATLSAKDIKAGYKYQWNYQVANDDPIIVEPISIQEWEKVLFENGSGAGTETW